MKKFISKLKSISNTVYDELGAGFEERTIQTAIGIELTKNNIKFLREVSIEVFYKGHPLGLFELDFLIYPCMDLNKPVIIETKVTSKLNDTARQQLKNYLRSAPMNNNEDLKKVEKGVLINFKVQEIFKDGINKTPEDKTSLEVWGFKNNKFKIVK
tara:strand:+ start:1258 stop:1725 length:468 start_codon:yes stop_codon:yes gene_type:complete